MVGFQISTFPTKKNGTGSRPMYKLIAVNEREISHFAFTLPPPFNPLTTCHFDRKNEEKRSTEGRNLLALCAVELDESLPPPS